MKTKALSIIALSLLILFIFSGTVKADPWWRWWCSYCGMEGSWMWADWDGVSADRCETGFTERIYAYQNTLFPTGYSFQWWDDSDEFCIYDPIKHTEHCVPAWAPIEGSTMHYLDVTEPGSYKCVVTPPGGPAYETGIATITTSSAAPTQFSIANDDPVCSNDNKTWTASANGEHLSYLWYRSANSGGSWSPQGIQEDQFTVEASEANTQYIYRCKIKNGCGEGYTPSAQLNIKYPPVIGTNPSDNTLCSGSGFATFNTNATGDDLTYQWMASSDGSTYTNLSSNNTVNQTNGFGGGYSSVTGSNMTITNPTYDPQNELYFKCTVSGSCSPQQSSSAARLFIERPLSLEDQSDNLPVCENEEVQMDVTSEGDSPIYYQWQVKPPSGSWMDIAGEVESQLVFDAGAWEENSEFRCNILQDNTCNGSLTTTPITLTTYKLPEISLGDDRHICPGDQIELDAGAGYVSYDWNGEQTTQKITIQDEGSYRITITDENGCRNNDTIFIHHDPLVKAVDLGKDTACCAGIELILDAGAGYDIYQWNNDSTGQTIKPVTSGKYWVKATNNNTVCEASDTINIIIAEPFDGDQICIVTVDLATGKNMVVWEKEPDRGIVAYKIYRETTIDEYDVIGTIASNELSIFKDLAVSPENRAYLYKIQAIDTCGNATDLTGTSYHKPIFLKYLPSDAGVNLTWTDYEIEDVPDLGDYLTSFEIYRGSDSTDLQFYTEVGSVNDYLDTDVTTETTKYWYRIAGVLKEPCYPNESRKTGTGPYRHSLSNMDNNKLKEDETGIGFRAYLPLQVYPNPFRTHTTIRFKNPESQEYTMRISDLSGKTVRIERDIRTDEFTLSRGNLQAGYYHIELTGKRIYRSKLIVK